MGKLILCSGTVAKQPYCFPMTQTKVYSIEEVCYYIRKNIYLMQEEVFDEAFAVWIREELHMEETADKLDRMREDHNNLKDIVVTLCCSCDYYTEAQIGELIQIMDATQDLPMRGRQKIKADSCLTSGKLEKARREYERILKSADMLQADGKEYAQVYRSLGSANLGMGEFSQAAQAFRKAYEYVPGMDTLVLWLFCLRLGGLTQEYQKTLRELEISREQLTFLEEQYEEMLYECDDSRGYRQVQRLRRMLQQGDPAFSGAAQELILQWKKDYRQCMAGIV